MRLSEAIRLGAMMKPQAKGWFLKAGKTCVQGAALDACGALTCEDGNWVSNHEQHEKMKAIWPWAAQFFQEMAIRNNAGESRESIADWVASIEPQEAPSCEQPSTAHSTETTTVATCS